jgi:predicted SprT family Zn-dependent metalloprotease
MTSEEKFEQENAHIFLYKLMKEFNDINITVRDRLHKRLELPRFVLHRGHSRWGYWQPKTRKLSLSEDLVRNFEWGAVVHVLKHEVAHMIVSEVFNMDDCRAHGEAFSKACRVIGVDDRRCCSTGYLDGFKGINNESSVVTRIRKLMAKGQCDGASEAEAEAFMSKAQSLMQQHNVSNTQVMGTEKVFIKRPVGGKHKRFPSWLWRLGDLVSTNYNVQNIRSYCYNSRTGERYMYLELFGEPHNVDVAEYVFHVVMSQGEAMYNRYKKDPNRQRGFRKLTKPAYMAGLIRGYASTLDDHRDDEDISDEDEALLLANDAILKERYRRAYPRMTTTHRAGPRGDGGLAGERAGSGINVRAGVGSGKGTLRIGG